MQDMMLVILGALIPIAYTVYQRRSEAKTSVSLARSEEVHNWGWDGPTLLKKLISFDKKVIGRSLTDEREGTVQQWAPIFTAHPDCWVLLVNGPRNIIGYWHFVALRPKEFGIAKECQLLDSQITLNAVVSLDVPGNYDLYFVMIGVLPEHPYGVSKLIDAFFDQLKMFAEKGIFFRRLCANAFTKPGDRLCKGFGMSVSGSHADFGTVYTLSLKDWPQKLKGKRWDELKRLYEEHFR